MLELTVTVRDLSGLIPEVGNYEVLGHYFSDHTDAKMEVTLIFLIDELITPRALGLTDFKEDKVLTPDHAKITLLN